MSKEPFIIVSNRLPVSVKRENGKLVFRPSSGGLATAMSSLKINQERVWVGWPGIAAEDLSITDRAIITRKLKSFGCSPVFLTKKEIELFYEGYSNSTIWPLFHYFQYQTRFSGEYWDAYQNVNKRFLKAILRHALPNSTIWVHDYHLMLLPMMLRKSQPKSSIGFFLHIPFPSFEIYRLLPERKEILEGLLGADLIGFHTYDYARHFMSSVLRSLGFESKSGTIMLKDRIVRVDSFPIGIDYKKFAETAIKPAIKKEAEAIREHYAGQKIVLSVDRLDYSKGIVERLEAFDVFLEQNTKYRKKIALVVIAVPSRAEVESYQQLRDVVEQTVSRINGKYASVDWTPISYQFQNLPFEEIISLYSAADVALVTPLRDGMNLVAKEFIAAKQDRKGVLIISEMAGAASELPEAMHVNPNNRQAIVRALDHALTIPVAKQRESLMAMQRRIERYNVAYWARDFMEQLTKSSEYNMKEASHSLSDFEQKILLKAYNKAKKRSIFLDYDGTLASYVKTPDPKLARPSLQVKRLLKKLAADPKNNVTIISGRSKETLQKWFDALPISLVAEHGAYTKQNGVWRQAKIEDTVHIKELRAILERYAERTPGAIIEEKSSSLVWHYRNVSPELAYVRNKDLRHDIANVIPQTVGIYSGNKIIEIKPRAIDKGHTVVKSLKRRSADFVLCAGDDYTDEDMFEAVSDKAYTVKVGSGETRARFRVSSVKDMLAILRMLAN